MKSEYFKITSEGDKVKFHYNLFAKVEQNFGTLAMREECKKLCTLYVAAVKEAQKPERAKKMDIKDKADAHQVVYTLFVKKYEPICTLQFEMGNAKDRKQPRKHTPHGAEPKPMTESEAEAGKSDNPKEKKDAKTAPKTTAPQKPSDVPKHPPNPSDVPKPSRTVSEMLKAASQLKGPPEKPVQDEASKPGPSKKRPPREQDEESEADSDGEKYVRPPKTPIFNFPDGSTQTLEQKVDIMYNALSIFLRPMAFHGSSSYTRLFRCNAKVSVAIKQIQQVRKKVNGAEAPPTFTADDKIRVNELMRIADFPLKSMEQIKEWFSIEENYNLLKAFVCNTGWNETNFCTEVVKLVVHWRVSTDKQNRWIPAK